MELRVPEDELALLPVPPPGLDAEQIRAWQRMRRKVGRRHETWRIGMPGLDELFEDDIHRAKALAGNLATEFGEVLRRTAQSFPGEVASEGSPSRWVHDSCQVWIRAIGPEALEASWSADTAAAFAQILGQLVDRERDRAVGLAVGAQTCPAQGAAGSRLAAGWKLLLSPVRRFLEPR